MANQDPDHDLNFTYDDCDSYENEISELYTYTEEIEYEENKNNFQKLLKEKEFTSWGPLNNAERTLVVQHIIQVLELSNKDERIVASTWLLHLVHGVYEECPDIKQQIANCRENCFLLYKLGLFTMVQDLLLMEINTTNMETHSDKKTTMLSLEDSRMLRLLISILYTMLETLRRPNSSDSAENVGLRKDFLMELEQNLNDKEPLVIVLFNTVSKFCSQPSSPMPMKKVLLLLWKLLLTTLGGFGKINTMKQKARIGAGLPLINEDPLKIVREMNASVPPTSASDLLDPSQGKRRGRRSVLYEFDAENAEIEAEKNNKSQADEPPFEEEKVTSIDDEIKLVDQGFPEESPLNETNGVVMTTGGGDASGPEPGVTTPMPNKGPTLTTDTAAIAAKLIKIRKEQEDAQTAETGPDIPTVKLVPGLPWVPKARKRDVEAFLNLVRQKFIGFPLPGDLTTVAGLPKPTQDSIKILNKHTYTSISDLQVDQESNITKCPLTIGKKEVIPETVTERLYQAMLPNLPQHMIALLKILLAAAPTAKSKNDSINILSDVLPKEMPTTAVTSLKLGIDVNRHREIIVKAISGTLLLLLKHFNLNHVYQFEYTSQHLVFANCIPLVLKFFNQNIVAYVTTKNTIPCLEFPACVIGKRTELTAEAFENVDASNAPCWRNLFSSINLLRILNKLVKWKNSRTMMLVVFKSAPILKRALKIRHGMFQLYVLKLLKVQTKFLGRGWRKNNMKTMSAIYQKVRHRLNDDWAFGNDIDARPWDFQQEECALRACVERFNVRRYHTTGSTVGNSPSITPGPNEEYQPVNNNMQTLLNEEVEFPVEFRKSYDVWLEREVYQSTTDWDMLLNVPCVQ
uniref:Striatin-interacting protein 1 homolog n=1 Tax=Phallusia mammillata TaxID=59560 RepID=A0A6F9DTA3_9ASCI|nr:striatin-interacting protein 1 homolog [Phallusia mammillata]